MEGYAMSQGTTQAAEVIRLRQNIGELLRRRVLEAVQMVLEEELSEALGSGRYERCEERRGYRNGHETRRITTEFGPQTLQVPRGRIVGDGGSTKEFRSEVVPRYARRTRKVDEAILGAYLAGANTRGFARALAQNPAKPRANRLPDIPAPTSGSPASLAAKPATTKNRVFVS